jgi:hypothetical protein
VTGDLMARFVETKRKRGADVPAWMDDDAAKWKADQSRIALENEP